MPVAAKRFTFLDTQTNVPVANLTSQKSSDLLNSGLNDLPNISTGATDLLSSNLSGGLSSNLLPSLPSTPSIGSEISSAVHAGMTAVSGISGKVLSAIGSEISSIKNSIGTAISTPASLNAKTAVDNAKAAVNSAGSIASSTLAQNTGQITLINPLISQTAGAFNSNAIQLTNLTVPSINNAVSSEISIVTGNSITGTSPLLNSASSLESALSSGLSSIPSVYSTLGPVRLTKDFLSSNINTAGSTSADLATAANRLGLGNSNTSNSIKQLSNNCKSQLLSNLGAKSRTSPIVSCPGGGNSRNSVATSCDLATILPVLSNASGGVYSPSIFDKFNLENAAALFSNGGYANGLCGVYKAMTSAITSPDSLSRIGSNVLGTAISSRDMMSVMDISSSINAGNVTSVIPGLAGNLFSNYNIPDEIKNSGLGAYSTKFIDSISNGLPSWNTSDTTKSLSAVNLGGSDTDSSSDINNTLLANSCFTATDPTLDPYMASIPDSSFLLTANQFSQDSVMGSLSAFA